jgi:hypothetical protein
MSQNSVPSSLLKRCLSEQQSDGGWVSVVDTMWNLYFLRLMGVGIKDETSTSAVAFLNSNINQQQLWGRSCRDMSRIPVSGMMLSLLPDLANLERLYSLEELWLSERNSLTYKAAYTLMAFRRTNFVPKNNSVIIDTINWLVASQRDDGSFAPWRDHPVASDVFYTGVAVVGLSCFPDLIPKSIFKRAQEWLLTHQLPQGIWRYHEIEEGALWGVWALTHTGRILKDKS